MRTWGVLVVLACASPAIAAPAAQQKECDAARGKQPSSKINPLAVRLTKSSEPIRSVVLRRFVQCGYVNKKLQQVDELVLLQIMTQDRGDVQFDTKNGAQTKSYYVECEAQLASAAKAKGVLSLSCVHRIHRKDGGEADRVTGVHSFKPQPGTFEITKATGTSRTIVFDGTVENQFEKLRLQGEASGAISTSVQVFDCSPPKPGTKPVRPEVCR